MILTSIASSSSVTVFTMRTIWCTDELMRQIHLSHQTISFRVIYLSTQCVRKSPSLQLQWHIFNEWTFAANVAKWNQFRPELFFFLKINDWPRHYVDKRGDRTPLCQQGRQAEGSSATRSEPWRSLARRSPCPQAWIQERFFFFWGGGQSRKFSLFCKLSINNYEIIQI